MKHLVTLFVSAIVILFFSVNLFAQEPVTIKIFDSEVNIFMMSDWEQTFKFASKDTISVKVDIIKGDNISRFDLRKWGKKALITRNEKQKIDEKYYNPKESAYTFYLKNSAILRKKIYHISIFRTTLIDSLIDFDVTFRVDTIVDTSFTNILNTTHELASEMGAIMGYKNEVEVSFQLPEDCTGDLSFIVGTEAGVNKMFSALKTSSTAVGIADPLTGILLGAITETMESTESYIKYYIVDYENLKLYRSGQTFHYKKKGENITAETAVISLKPKNYYYFIVINPATSHSRKVSIQAKAMKTKQTLHLK